jgi:hypothetical protein
MQDRMVARWAPHALNAERPECKNEQLIFLTDGPITIAAMESACPAVVCRFAFMVRLFAFHDETDSVGDACARTLISLLILKCQCPLLERIDSWQLAIALSPS